RIRLAEWSTRKSTLTPATTMIFGKRHFAETAKISPATFSETIIQSWIETILALKVEVYGTADHEDPHAQVLLSPDGKNKFKVASVFHDNVHKFMMGTMNCCILVTLAVNFTDGTVVVGPDNRTFIPMGRLRVWIKKDTATCSFTKKPRQLRSKFNDNLQDTSAKQVLLVRTRAGTSSQ
ncbi:hypothetical protein BGZ94_005994, partial [Podila epigama]